MGKLFDKVFRKFGTKTIRVHAAILRHPKKIPAEITAFLETLMPQVESGKLSNEEFARLSHDFYGDDPLIFVGYVALDKRDGKLHFVDPSTGELLGLPLAGDKIIGAHDFNEALRRGDIQPVEQSGVKHYCGLASCRRRRDS